MKTNNKGIFSNKKSIESELPTSKQFNEKELKKAFYQTETNQKNFPDGKNN